MTNGDIGRRVLKFGIFVVTSFLNDPYEMAAFNQVTLNGTTLQGYFYQDLTLSHIHI